MSWCVQVDRWGHDAASEAKLHGHADVELYVRGVVAKSAVL